LIEGNKAYIPINGHYVNGFLAGDGSLGLSLTSTKFCVMNLSFSQHVLNRSLMESIANYFQSPTKIYPHGPNSIQITLRGTKLWENVIFKHFSEYPLLGSKTVRLGKLFAIREFLASDEYLMKVGRTRQWKPEAKQRVIEIWSS
jgi:LAGLIDADG endonuclease